MYTLIMWLSLCVFDCEIEGYEVIYYDDLATCIKARDIYRGIKPENEGYCVNGKIPPWDELKAWDSPNADL